MPVTLFEHGSDHTMNLDGIVVTRLGGRLSNLMRLMVLSWSGWGIGVSELLVCGCDALRQYRVGDTSQD